MALNDDNRDKTKKLSAKGDRKSDVYISYNSLSQRGEIKSVSQAMHNYIKEGFDKIIPEKKNAT